MKKDFGGVFGNPPMIDYKIKLPDHCWYCSEIIKAINAQILLNIENKRFPFDYRFGVNEIARLVKNKMSSKTAIKHIRELIEFHYLDDGDTNNKEMLKLVIKLAMVSATRNDEGTTLAQQVFAHSAIEYANYAFAKRMSSQKSSLSLSYNIVLKTLTS